MALCCCDGSLLLRWLRIPLCNCEYHFVTANTTFDGSLQLRWLFAAAMALCSNDSCEYHFATANTTLQLRIPLCNCEYHFATANTTFDGSLQLPWLFAATIAANTTLQLRIPLF